MQPIHRLHREAIEQTLLHHHPATAFVFLGGLEDQHHGAVEAAGFGQVTGRPQQHGGVAVMAAGVHATGMAAGVDWIHAGSRARREKLTDSISETPCAVTGAATCALRPSTRA